VPKFAENTHNIRKGCTNESDLLRDVTTINCATWHPVVETIYHFIINSEPE